MNNPNDLEAKILARKVKTHVDLFRLLKKPPSVFTGILVGSVPGMIVIGLINLDRGFWPRFVLFVAFMGMLSYLRLLEVRLNALVQLFLAQHPSEVLESTSLSTKG